MWLERCLNKRSISWVYPSLFNVFFNRDLLRWLLIDDWDDWDDWYPNRGKVCQSDAIADKIGPGSALTTQLATGCRDEPRPFFPSFALCGIMSISPLSPSWSFSSFFIPPPNGSYGLVSSHHLLLSSPIVSLCSLCGQRSPRRYVIFSLSPSSPTLSQFDLIHCAFLFPVLYSAMSLFYAIPIRNWIHLFIYHFRHNPFILDTLFVFSLFV